MIFKHLTRSKLILLIAVTESFIIFCFYTSKSVYDSDLKFWDIFNANQTLKTLVDFKIHTKNLTFIPSAHLFKKFEQEVHRQYWRWRENKYTSRPNQIDNKQFARQVNFSFVSEQEFLSLFKYLSIWSAFQYSHQLRQLKSFQNVSMESLLVADDPYGFSSDYDFRLMAQDIWATMAEHFDPDIFKNNKTKQIGVDRYREYLSETGSPMLRCPGSSLDERCEIKEMNMFFMEKENFDAYIFNSDRFNQPPVVPEGANNLRVFYVLESPYHSTNMKLARGNDILSSYWRGSELETPYSKWAYFDPNTKTRNQSRNYAKGKTKMAVAVVSNCDAKNDRLKYINQLKRFIDVDIYGGCGLHKCEMVNANGESCFVRLGREYKFYLAFENSNCRDYITEKFFMNALGNDIVPIVLGAHPSDYAAAAPYNSYIHVEDFESPASLATYLKQLGEDDEAYNKYFQWKGTGSFVSADIYCRVCTILFNGNEDGREKMSNFDWTPSAMCLPQGKWYWNRNKTSSNISKQDTSTILSEIEIEYDNKINF